jgi:hypothetical protein
MAQSRTALDYVRRKGLSIEALRPRPRLAVDELLVHSVPLASPPMPSQTVLRMGEGDTPPDHGLSVPWPGQS